MAKKIPARTCKGTSKRTGKPCRVAPLKDRDYCRAHDAELPDSARFGSRAQAKEAAKLGGRPRLPRPTEVARELVEENVLAILRPHFLTLGYDVEIVDGGPVLTKRQDGGAKLYGTSREGLVRVSDAEDLAAMIAAAEKLLDRVYGRPKQATELTGPDGGPVQTEATVVEVAPPADRRAQILKLAAGAVGQEPEENAA